MTISRSAFAVIFDIIILVLVVLVATKIVIHSLKCNYENPDDKIHSVDVYAQLIIVFMTVCFECAGKDFGNPVEFLSFLLITVPFTYVPFLFTYINFKNLANKSNKSCFAEMVSIFHGMFCWFALIEISNDISQKPYYEAVYSFQKHQAINEEYGRILITLLFLSLIALVILCSCSPENSSPLMSAFAISFTVIGLVIFMFINIQFNDDGVSYEFENYYFMRWIYYINLFIIAVKRIQFHITEHVRIANERHTVYRSSFAMRLSKIAGKISSMTVFSFIMIIPIAVVVEILYILVGQGADGAIKAFTETADWTFSQQIPPPPLEYDGHYLCTVASGGHKKIVKPLRYGKRCGHIIIVNRQLLTANAFEDLIAEKTPKFHRAVRTFYNKYGYPVSKHITNELRADIVYILMKPLEWIFLVTLYLFDSQPENRIAIQYSDYKRRI